MRKLRGLVFSGFGETKTATEWALDCRCNVSARTVYQRLGNGEPLVEAITRPAFKFPETGRFLVVVILPIRDWICSVGEQV